MTINFGQKPSNKAKLFVRLKSIKLLPFDVLLLFGISFIVITTMLIAFIAPPNSWDSMTYHMSRVTHWMQHQSVFHYPTHITRQLFLSPWAEFSIMHFQILTGSDRFANLVQWFSMVGSLIGISLITKLLGANLRGQVLAALIVVTIPNGILQSSSTQNDYVASFWLVCFVYYLLQLKKDSKMIYSLYIGASLGLALLTKATAYIYIVPFMTWFGLSELKRLRWRLWKPFFIILTLALTINFGHYARNFDLYKQPIGEPQHRHMNTNDLINLSSIISNSVRNIGLHIGTPCQQVNTFIEKGVKRIHRLLSIDVNDQRTTFLHTKFNILFSFHEGFAGNLVHLVLILLSVFLFLIMRKQMKSFKLGYYPISLALGFILICLYIKWNPWNSRYHLPLFVLFSPFAAITLSNILWRKMTTNFIAVILFLTALPFVFNNCSRPLIGKKNIFITSRTDQYFHERPYLKEPYIGAINFLKNKGCKDIGLAIGGDDWEYPLWTLLMKNYGHGLFRLEHFNVKNISSTKSNISTFKNFSPCAIVSVRLLEFPPEPDEKDFYKAWLYEPVTVFVKK
jgi:4-amino-4-deoxy-L-arabinose transferase-like glycosyltransferase